MPGPSADRLAALIVRLQDLLDTLAPVAGQAQAAIAESETDRAGMHAQLDDHAARIAALEAAATPPTGG
jgi:hypothetical protein